MQVDAMIPLVFQVIFLLFGWPVAVIVLDFFGG